jgi:hypothetical protein
MELKHLVTYASEHSAIVVCSCGERYTGDTMAQAIDWYAAHIVRTTIAEAVDFAKQRGDCV